MSQESGCGLNASPASESLPGCSQGVSQGWALLGKFPFQAHAGVGSTQSLRTFGLRAVVLDWLSAGGPPPCMFHGPPHMGWPSPCGILLQSQPGRASVGSLQARWKLQTYIMFLRNCYPITFALVYC